MLIALCDDNQNFDYNAQLSGFLKNYMQESKIDNYQIQTYTSGTEFLGEFRPGLFDFIFLDVDMPELDGFETAARIRKLDLKADIIFVTNMHDKSLLGYNYNAKGYLYKPATQEQINELMDRLLAELLRREETGVFEVRLKFDGGKMYLRLADVLYFESMDKDILAITEHDSFTFRGQLSEVAEKLDGKGFIRIHRSFLANTNHVFKDFGGKLVMSNSEELPISQKYRKDVRLALEGRW